MNISTQNGQGTRNVQFLEEKIKMKTYKIYSTSKVIK